VKLLVRRIIVSATAEEKSNNSCAVGPPKVLNRKTAKAENKTEKITKSVIR